MKKLLTLAIFIAAAAGGPAASLASNGGHGGGRGFGGGMHGGPHLIHGFFPALHHPFPFRRNFVVVGAAFPLGYGYYGYYDYAPAAYPAGQAVYLYCPNPPGYYPELQDCPAGWLRVLE